MFSNFKISILRIELSSSIKQKDLDPYLSLRIGQAVKKTQTNFHRDPYNAIFVEHFEFGSISKKLHLNITLYHRNNFLLPDKYLGEANVALDNPILGNLKNLSLLNDQEKAEKLVGYVYLKISAEGGGREEGTEEGGEEHDEINSMSN
jgi:hypothetical protein